MAETEYEGYSKTARELAKESGRHPREFTVDSEEYPVPDFDELEPVPDDN